MDKFHFPLVSVVGVGCLVMNIILLGIYTEVKRYGRAKENFFQFEVDERFNCV